MSKVRTSLHLLLQVLFATGLLGGAMLLGLVIGRGQAPAAAPDSGTLYTCSMHPQVQRPEPGLCPICHMELVPLAPAAPTASEPGIQIDPVMVQRMAVRVATVGRGPLDHTVHALGVLRPEQPRQREFALKVAGYVEKLHAHTEGMALSIGAPLLELYSPELLVAQEELLASRRSGDALLLDTARRKLALWDVDAEQIAAIEQGGVPRRTLLWRSPVAGTLTERLVVEGAPVEAAHTLLRIVDLSELWLDAQVPERELAAVVVGQRAQATLTALPAEALAGEVVFVAPVLEEATRSATVRVALANPAGRLKPGMYARLEVKARLAEDALLVPREAVLDTGQRQMVFLALGEGRFVARDVRLGASGDGGLVQVLEGLVPGDVVVTSGQLLLDAESRVREGAARLLADGLLPASGELPRLSLSAASRAQVDALARSYLALTATMAGDQPDPTALAGLARAAAELAGAEPEVVPLAAAVQAALAPLAGLPLAEQRQHLGALSDRVVELLTRAPPSPALGPRLLVIHCPMFPGQWLQASEPLRNPYYGPAMLECGEVRRRIELAEDGK